MAERFTCGGIIPAIITPFKRDTKAVDLDAIVLVVDRLLAHGAAGFFVCGNTGEGDEQTVDERKQVSAAVVERTAHKVPCIIHVGAAGGTDNSVELAKHAKEIGAEAVSSVVPTDDDSAEAAIKHFKAIGSATDLPFYVYWFKGGGGVTIQPKAYNEMLKEVPNVHGVKFTDTNFFYLQQLQTSFEPIYGKSLNVLTGPDEMAICGLAMGFHGAIGSTYNVLTKTFVAMYNSYRAGDIVKAQKYQAAANRGIVVLAEISNCATRGKNIYDGIKAVLAMQGIDVGVSRGGTPYQDDRVAQIRAAWKELEADEYFLDPLTC